MLAIALLVGCSGEPKQANEGGTASGNIVTEIDAGRPEQADHRGDAVNQMAAPRADATDGGAIPVRFRGEWRVDRKNCGNLRDTMGVRVEAGRLLFYESEGTVRSVRETGENALAISADYTGEGDSWSRWSTLKLTDTGDLLLDDVKRVRCR